MEETILQPLFHGLDPISLILSQYTSQSDQPIPLRLTTTTDTFYALERGPRYEEYAVLRESKMRLKSQPEQQEEGNVNKDCNFRPSPPRKQVKFQTSHLGSRKAGHFGGVVAQSVPDFSATLRKENRKPPPTHESASTPPRPLPGSGSKYWSNASGALSGSRGSKSANSMGEKKGRNGNVCGGGGGGGGLMARKSYANLEELKGLGLATSSAINGESRGIKGGGGGRGGVGNGKTVLGYRQF